MFVRSLTVAQHDTSVIEEGDSEIIEEFGTGSYNAQHYYRRNGKSKSWSWRGKALLKYTQKRSEMYWYGGRATSCYLCTGMVVVRGHATDVVTPLAETKRFYLALSVVGTDFSLMSQLFRNRSRLDIKVNTS